MKMFFDNKMVIPRNNYCLTTEKVMEEKKKYGKESFTTLAMKYQLSYPTFIKNIKAIRKKMDACVGRSNYRNLVPSQIEIIVLHLGEWDD